MDLFIHNDSKVSLNSEDFRCIFVMWDGKRGEKWQKCHQKIEICSWDYTGVAPSFGGAIINFLRKRNKKRVGKPTQRRHIHRITKKLYEITIVRFITNVTLIYVLTKTFPNRRVLNYDKELILDMFLGL